MSAEEWDAVVAAANEEGTVTLYTAQGLDQANQLKAAFEAEYPDITVEVVRDISSNLIPKIEAERQTGSGIADVYVSADTAWWEQTATDGHIIPITGPAFSDAEYDPSLIHADTYFEPSAVVFGYGWNTNNVPDGLSDMTDVLNPEFEGKIGVVEPSLEALVDFWKYLEEQYGEDFVTQLADLNPRIYPGAGPLREALASGEISVSTYNSPMPDLEAQGAPVALDHPRDGVGRPLLRRHRRHRPARQRGAGADQLHGHPPRPGVAGVQRVGGCPARHPEHRGRDLQRARRAEVHARGDHRVPGVLAGPLPVMRISAFPGHAGRSCARWRSLTRTFQRS